ncbi:MAG: 3',5'-cyclic-nucleotide phosphodiesterase, partial [Candidatus Mariimomonas ferrooxydans]
MKIKVLGCSGAEFPGFGPPAFLLDDRILLDAGTITGSLDEVAQKKISHILITHAHLDHIRGIPTLADNMFLINRKHSFTLMGIKKVLDLIKKNLFNNAVWPDFTIIPNPRKPLLKLKAIKTGKSFKIKNYKIIAEKVNHSIAAAGYIIEDLKGKKLIYTGDTGPTDRLWKRANAKQGKAGSYGAIIEVTFPNKMREAAIKTGHLTPDMLLNELKKLTRSLSRDSTLPQPSLT